MPRRDRDRDDGPPREGRPRPSLREVLRLIRSAYAVTLPWFLVFLAGLILTTWIAVTLLF